LAASLSRVIPHPPNFTPLLAVALFSAAVFTNRWVGMMVPQVAMIASDLALEWLTRSGVYTGWLATGQGFYSGMWVTYVSIFLVSALGLVLRHERSIATVADGSIAGSILFFTVTNFAWWAGYDLYPHTMAGLVASYVAALPFFGWTLLSTLAYSALLFGGLEAARRWTPAANDVAGSCQQVSS
jgi:uncharacterized membrane protein